MSPIISQQRILDIVAALVAVGEDENEVAEFKSNHLEPSRLGEYISALANAAAIRGRKFAYLVFGVEDGTKRISGTTFNPEMKAAGNQSLMPWLHGKLSESAHFDFHETLLDERRLVLLVVSAAQTAPVAFAGTAWCRVGSHKKKLSDHIELERQLWRSFDKTPFELRAASDALSGGEVLDKLSFDTYFDLRATHVNSADDAVTELAKAGMIVPADVVGWYVTNMGALMLARRLSDFPSVERKAVRLIRYQGLSKGAAASEILGAKGYAVGFAGLVRETTRSVPAREDFTGGIRRKVPAVSERVLRELVANALIHQDLSIQGVGPTIDVYEDRIEIGNPGESLIPPERIIDGLAQSRNEKFAAAGRAMGLCDERGSGWDLVGDFIELEGLPAPMIESNDGSMRVTVWWKRPFEDYSREEQLRALFFHSLVQHAKKQRVTNATVKQRFNLPEKDGGKASKLLREAVNNGMLKIFDTAVGAKIRSYVPNFVETE